MKTTHKVFLNLCLLLSVVVVHAQDSFNSCSAAFLDTKMIVNAYTTEGKCNVSHQVTGKLLVAEVELFEDGKANITQSIEFMVAIRDQNTKTLMMYSNEVFREVAIEKIMAKCRKGDHIVLLTLSNKYALPHNEILVQ
ncbi:MAG: hypothetical protein MUE30_03530 [Spirosomaceae bacterium]|jgi:hypothetical protein|nr:hypothetical protein [Spirosomataceae bacterium]